MPAGCSSAPRSNRPASSASSASRSRSTAPSPRFAPARRQLDACGDAATMQNAQDRFTLLLRRAELALAEGDAGAAQAALASLGEAPNRELEVVRQTCALRAAAAAGQDPAAALAAS